MDPEAAKAAAELARATASAEWAKVLNTAIGPLIGVVGTPLGGLLLWWVNRSNAKLQIEGQRAVALDARRWDRRVQHVEALRTAVNRLGLYHAHLAAAAMAGRIDEGQRLLLLMDKEADTMFSDLSFRVAGRRYAALELVQQAFASLDAQLRPEAIRSVQDPERFKALGPRLMDHIEAFRHVVISVLAVCEAYIADEPPPDLLPGIAQLAELHRNRQQAERAQRNQDVEPPPAAEV